MRRGEGDDRSWVEETAPHTAAASLQDAARSPLRSDRMRGEEQDRSSGEGSDLADLIADLERRIAHVSRYLDEVKVGNGTGGTATIDEYVRLVGLHGQLCSRVGRLMRDRQQLRGEDDSELQAVMNEALDLAGEILGLEV